MNRDLDLVRAILTRVEDTPAGKYLEDLKFEGYDHATVLGHIELLIESGLIEGKMMTHISPPSGTAAIKDLTSAGHDFVAAARDDTVWQKAKHIAIKRGGAVTFDIFLQLLKAQLRAHFGGGDLPG